MTGTKGEMCLESISVFQLGRAKFLSSRQDESSHRIICDSTIIQSRWSRQCEIWLLMRVTCNSTRSWFAWHKVHHTWAACSSQGLGCSSFVCLGTAWLVARQTIFWNIQKQLGALAHLAICGPLGRTHLRCWQDMLPSRICDHNSNRSWKWAVVLQTWTAALTVEVWWSNHVMHVGNRDRIVITKAQHLTNIPWKIACQLVQIFSLQFHLHHTRSSAECHYVLFTWTGELYRNLYVQLVDSLFALITKITKPSFLGHWQSRNSRTETMKKPPSLSKNPEHRIGHQMEASTKFPRLTTEKNSRRSLEFHQILYEESWKSWMQTSCVEITTKPT